MTKELNGRELASYIKERQAHEARSLRAQLGREPRLAIIRDNDSPVITKYVQLKQRYGDDIGVRVDDVKVEGLKALQEAVRAASADPEIDGIIVQLPLTEPSMTDEVVKLIAPEKDVDGLNSLASNGETEADGGSSNDSSVVNAGSTRKFDSATATAIHWLLNGYGVELAGKKIAVVGRGRLVGAPLIRMWKDSGYDVTVFGHDGDLGRLPEFEIIVTATGVPHLIKSEMVASGAVIVDAGTASEGGVLVGDIDDAVREREDLGAITPKVGGVGPMTVTMLFEGVLRAARGH